MWKAFAVMLALLLLMSAARQQPIGVDHCVGKFRMNAAAFAASVTALRQAIAQIDTTDSHSIEMAKRNLRNARLSYKRIEFFLDYFFFTSSHIYNRPAKHEIEEPHLEYAEPSGLQYIEALLFDNPAKNQEEMLKHCRLMETAAHDLPALLYNFNATDAHVLESLRIELVKVIALSITGFDAPLLKSGLREAFVSLQTMQEVLNPYIIRADHDLVYKSLVSCQVSLTKAHDFDSFDRMYFLTRYALPLQEHLGQLIVELGLETNEAGILNYRAKNLFSPDVFAPTAFGGTPRDSALADLGKKLFFETRLSSNGTRSCASCHPPELHFADALPKSMGIHPGQPVRRNAPTLLYSGLQHAQFWDGRAQTLEEQVKTVIHDSLEMNGKPAFFVRKMARSRSYRKLLAKMDHPTVDDTLIYQAIAAYLRTLRPFNSDFDRYMAGDKSALTEAQVSGFNLFMGKAQCGTCHFAPLFNGLIPPLYKLTEFEVLGTTVSDDFAHPEPDTDQGRFEARPTPYFRHAFKTPTVRNAGVTGPYMHNGAFRSLEAVVDFYDKGGGAGLGTNVPGQTLSAAPLNLTDKEKSDIVAFLKGLTDHL